MGAELLLLESIFSTEREVLTAPSESTALAMPPKRKPPPSWVASSPAPAKVKVLDAKALNRLTSSDLKGNLLRSKARPGEARHACHEELQQLGGRAYHALSVWRPSFSGKLRNFAATGDCRGPKGRGSRREAARAAIRFGGLVREDVLKCTIAPGFGPKETPSSASRHETKLHTDQVFLTGLRSRK
jgi:hypothetical protein